MPMSICKPAALNAATVKSCWKPARISSSSAEVGATVIKSVAGRPVYLRDVARIEDGPADVDHYTRIGFGPAVDEMPTIGKATGNKPQVGQERQMVTIAVAKRKGSNAVNVAEAVIATAEKLHGTLIPEDVLLTHYPRLR